MAKLVYSAYAYGAGDGSALATYSNADFIIVKASGAYLSSDNQLQLSPCEGVKIMKGCQGYALVWVDGSSNTDIFESAPISYNSDGTVSLSYGARNDRFKFHVEFYKQS